MLNAVYYHIFCTGLFTGYLYLVNHFLRLTFVTCAVYTKGILSVKLFKDDMQRFFTNLIKSSF